MRHVVVDASALAAIVLGEPRGMAVADDIDGALVFAPTLLRFELGNAAWKKIRRHPSEAANILSALATALDGPRQPTWKDVQPADVVLVAHATGLSVYDASYLWLAGSLGADLVTLDTRLSAAGNAWLE